MAKMELHLLGNPQIYVDGQAVINFNTRKDCALLIYLAVTGTTHSRETLAGLLWPELPEENARRNLRHALAHLQKTIGPQWLAMERGVALTQVQPWSVDVHTLRTTVKSLTTGANATATRHDPQALTTLDQTLQLYRGEFLQGFHLHEAAHFEEWTLAEREELRLLTLRGLEILVEGCLAHGMYEQGLAATQRLLQLEPWSEPAHRRQMQLLALSGQRAAALAQFEKCRTVLVAELGVEPEPATVALYQQIRDQPGLSVGQPASTALQPAAAVVSPIAVVPPLYHNLPGQLTRLIGRSADIIRLRDLLLTPEHRLVTVVGEGGIGKTRLALAVAQSWVDEAQTQPGQALGDSYGQSLRPFRDGIGFVPLAGLAATELLAEQLATAVAKALRLQFGSKEPPFQQLQDYLSDKALLLLFDNVEHLLPQAADFLVELLQLAPQLKIVATSRHLLNLQAEVVVRLNGLPTPPPAELATLTTAALLTYSSVALFVERAQRANPTFQITAANQVALGQICHLVNGLPLAIELAAIQTRRFTCPQILTELQQSYTVLDSTLRDLAPRHRSIRALLAYSWQFLSPEAAQLLAACAIFRGTFSQAAVTAIVGATADALFTLVDQSLVQLSLGEEHGGSALFALHELIRQYGAEQLQTQPAAVERLRTAHAHYYLTLLAEQRPIFVADLAALQQMQREIDNLRAAWAWACAHGQWDLLIASAYPLRQFYDLLGLSHEAESSFGRAVAQVQQLPAQGLNSCSTQARLVAHLQTHQLHFCKRLDQIPKAEELAQAALEVGRQLDDHTVQGYVFLTLSTVYGLRADWVGAQRAAEQALAHSRVAALPLLEVLSLQHVGYFWFVRSNLDQALSYLHHALALYHTLTTDASQRDYLTEGLLCLDLGEAYQSAGDLAQARAYYQQSIEFYRQMSIPILGVNTLSRLSELNSQLGSFVQASVDAEMALEICRSMGGRPAEATLLGNLAYACLHLGDWVKADRACQLLFDRIKPLGFTRLRPFAYFIQGELKRTQRQWQAALTAYETAQEEYTAIQQMERAASTQAKMAQVWLQIGELPKALALVEAVLPHLSQIVQYSWLQTTADFLICYQVLAAAGDPRATLILQQGYQHIQAQAAAITDEGLRQSYLTHVPANRALVELAARAGMR